MGSLLLGHLLLFTWWCGVSKGPPLALEVGASSFFDLYAYGISFGPSISRKKKKKKIVLDITKGPTLVISRNEICCA